MLFKFILRTYSVENLKSSLVKLSLGEKNVFLIKKACSFLDQVYFIGSFALVPKETNVLHCILLIIFETIISGLEM